MMRWYCHQLDHTQHICTSLHTDNHALMTKFFTGWTLFLTPNQQCQSTQGRYRPRNKKYSRDIILEFSNTVRQANMMHVTFNIATQTIINTSLLMNIFQVNLGRLVPSRFSLSMCSRRETRTHTVLRSFFRDYPGGLVTEEIFFWTFMVEDNRGRHIDHPAGCHSIRTNQRPTHPHFYAGSPS